METINYLKEEHKIIKNLIDLLERSSERMKRNKEIPPWMLRENLELLQIYINGAHCDREELMLSRMEDRGIEVERGMFFDDYRTLRKYERFLLDVIEAYDLGYQGARSVFAHYSGNYLDILRKHMNHERELLRRCEDTLKDIDLELLREVKSIDGGGMRMREKGLSRIEELMREFRKVAA